jgi:hypothetical protein
MDLTIRQDGYLGGFCLARSDQKQHTQYCPDPIFHTDNSNRFRLLVISAPVGCTWKFHASRENCGIGEQKTQKRLREYFL